MKDAFKGFYNIEKTVLEELWMDEKTLFVFDTNVLLNLYGYAKQTRDDFFSILEAVNDKLWIPYHVGLEYQRRRLSIIRNEKIVFNEIESNLDKVQKVFKGDFEKLALKRRFPKLFENTEKLEKEINKSISNYKKSVQHWDSEQPCVRSHDEIRDKLNDLFNEKVGEKPESQKWLDELYVEGKDRFKKKVPPGFKDAGKGNSDDETHFYNDGLYYERQYGDLILWKQLIKKSQNENIENVIFITDDAKEDWWYKINSNGKKTVGPLAELQSEIYRESDIKNFHMYSTSMFLEDGKSNLAVDVSESSIEDASTPHVTENSSGLASKLMESYRAQSIKNDQWRELIDRTHKIKSIDNDRWREALERTNNIPSIDNDRLREALERTNNIPSIDNDRLREALERTNNIPSIDNDRLREALERTNNIPSIDSDRLREALERTNHSPSIDNERLKAIFESQGRTQTESDIFYKNLNSYLRKKDEDD
ncbi:PIN-like domain-containing protein [Shewanella sp. 10N.7]|uniref:PIN-like domain-containing protein n=1 Tax=Shewanella sp. 10N.7 TaxID=2885093 RepID=UPI001E51C949|nr:PIN-like domain-containing protein [Shewanella sp. 10N.7]MCC4831602.1 PIN-like domain-containing protein [Shewanella sp. 10N.7]